jgi:hypothetical protein
LSFILNCALRAQVVALLEHLAVGLCGIEHDPGGGHLLIRFRRLRILDVKDVAMDLAVVGLQRVFLRALLAGHGVENRDFLRTELDDLSAVLADEELHRPTLPARIRRACDRVGRESIDPCHRSFRQPGEKQ